MPATYEPIATTTLSSAAATITFSSIGSGYTDLRLVLLVSSTDSSTNVRLQFNSDTGTNYSNTNLSGNGTTAASSRRTSVANIQFTNSTASSTTIPQLYTADIFSYAGSTNKTLLATTAQDYNGSGGVERIVGLWRNTAAITSITLLTSGAPTFSSGTTATLYGILKA